MTGAPQSERFERPARSLRPAVGDKKWPDLSRGEKVAVLDWVVDTCLLYGASEGTAFAVAGIFPNGLDNAEVQP